MANQLSLILDDYNATIVRAIADECGVETLRPKGGNVTKVQLVSRLPAKLTDPARVFRMHQALSDVEKQVLNRILHHKPPVVTSTLKRELLRVGLVEAYPVETTSYGYHEPRYKASPTRDGVIFEDVLARLTRAGLVFSQGVTVTGGSKFNWTPADTLVVPEEIRAALPTPQPLLKALREPLVGQPIVGNPMQFVRELYLYWSAIRPKPLPLLKSGQPGKRILKEINAALLIPQNIDKLSKETDSFYLQWLRLTLMAHKLLGIENNQLHAKQAQFWQKPLGQQIAAVLKSWSDSSQLQELSKASDYSPTYTRARRAILNTLRDVPEGWLAFGQVVEQVQRNDTDFLFGRSRIESRHVYYSYERSSRQAQLDRLDELEDKLVDIVMRDVLCPLGIVECGLIVESGAALRVTEFGRKILRQQRAEWLSDDAGRIIVQPSFEVLAMGSVGVDKLVQLDEMAERVAVDSNVFSYRLTRDSIYNALQNDLKAAQIMHFLTEQSGQPLPQNVQRSIVEWGTRHERIVFRQGVSLLQAATPELLKQLLEHRRTKPLLARTVGKTLALVKPDDQQKLVKLLLSADHLPAVGGVDPASTNHAIRMTDEGQLKPIHAVPSLLLTGRLAKIAEQTESGWRLTERSVAAVASNKAEAEVLLAELAQLASGTVPAAVVADVKQWSGYYGMVSAETVTLIEFQDKATLKEILEHPELAPYLTPFPAGNRALAVVADGKLRVVKQQLKVLGISIKKGGKIT